MRNSNFLFLFLHQICGGGRSRGLAQAFVSLPGGNKIVRGSAEALGFGQPPFCILTSLPPSGDTEPWADPRLRPPPPTDLTHKKRGSPKPKASADPLTCHKIIFCLYFGTPQTNVLILLWDPDECVFFVWDPPGQCLQSTYVDISCQLVGPAVSLIPSLGRPKPGGRFRSDPGLSVQKDKNVQVQNQVFSKQRIQYFLEFLSKN